VRFRGGDFIKTVAPAKTEAGNKVTSATPTGTAPAVIVVLGAKVLPDGRPSGAMERRMQVALALYRAGVAPVLLLSGGGQPIPEAEVMRRMALAAGVPESALMLEPMSRNTLENATQAALLLAARPDTAIVLVTDRYHAFRARMLFRLVGLTVRAVHVAAVPPRRHLTMLVTESVKLPISVVRALFQIRG
jgi:uncharacterized SAM-binding protein YcdF (DUF218 family)